MAIFSYSTPAKVLQPVVFVIPVQVPTFKPSGSWSYKGFQNKCVNTQQLPPVQSRKDDIEVAITIYFGSELLSFVPWLGFSSAVARANGENGSIFRDRVSRETGDLPESGGYIRHSSAFLVA